MTKIFIFVFFLLMATAALLGGGYLLVRTISLKTNGVNVKAEFVGYVETSSSRPVGQIDNGMHKNRYLRQFKFVVDADTIVATTKSASDETDLTAGDEVMIVYDANDPASIAEPSKINNNLVAGIVCFVLGALVMLITLVMRRKLNEPAAAKE